MRVKIKADYRSCNERAWEVYMPWDKDGKLVLETDGILDHFHVEDMEDGETRWFTLAVNMMHFA